MKCLKDKAKVNTKEKSRIYVYATWFLCKQWGLLIMQALISPQELIRALSAAERGPNHPVERERDRDRERETSQAYLHHEREHNETHWECHCVSVALTDTHTHTHTQRERERGERGERERERALSGAILVKLFVCSSLKPVGNNLKISKAQKQIKKNKKYHFIFIESKKKKQWLIDSKGGFCLLNIHTYFTINDNKTLYFIVFLI